MSYWINRHNDTFYVEYGAPNIIDNLFNPPPVVYDMKNIELPKRILGRIPAPDEALFSKTPKEDMEQNVFDQNYYRYDTINGIVAKIIQPKVIGKGMTGIYIYELKDKHALSIYAMDLDYKSNDEALGVFRTIKYK
ncbi:hypothetical protein CK934_02210 [Chitinophaga sp. MD30]|nr:hypothetical protein CK934_02210 [Chitinophaga sp. MD30]